MKNSTATMASAETPSTIFDRVGSFMMVSAKLGIYGSDLGVEDVLGGLDDLVADLRGELHRELRALDGHDDRRRILGGPRGERLRSGRGVRLGLGQLAQRVAEQRAEAAAGRRAGARGRGIDALDR